MLMLFDDSLDGIDDAENDLHPSMDMVNLAPLDWPETVLCGAADESLVAAEGCGEAEKRQVVAGVAFVAVIEPAVSGQPGHGAFDHPSSAPQPFAGLDSLAGDTDTDVLAPQPFRW